MSDKPEQINGHSCAELCKCGQVCGRCDAHADHECQKCNYYRVTDASVVQAASAGYASAHCAICGRSDNMHGPDREATDGSHQFIAQVAKPPEVPQREHVCMYCKGWQDGGHNLFTEHEHSASLPQHEEMGNNTPGPNDGICLDGVVYRHYYKRSCIDKSRFLLPSEDGKFHCLALGHKP